MRLVHLVVPAGVADPTRPSGGNAYDRRVRDGLVEHGWRVVEHEVDGEWPHGDAAARAALTCVLAALPEGTPVLIDGLVACGMPGAVVPEAARLRLVVLVHLPIGHRAVGAGGAAPTRDLADEATVLRVADAVVTTSRWTRDWLVDTYDLSPDDVTVATPGTDATPPAVALDSGARLLCVGAVTHGKGQELLVEALAELADLEWCCRCVGSVGVDRDFAESVRRRVVAAGLGDRLALPGPVVGSARDDVYATSDLLVAPSRVETFGMVVTEALARGIPVVAARVGGLPEALGRAPDGQRPGILVAPGDQASLADALREWLTDPALRQRLRLSAFERRSTLHDWSRTSERIAGVLAAVAG